MNRPSIVALTEGDSSNSLDESDGVARIVRLASGKASSEDLRFLGMAARTWIDSDGEITFERCMRLPTTPDAFRCMQRDRWLCEAAGRLGGASAWAMSCAVSDQWAVFVARGPWREWRDDADPPKHASPLSCALFYASHFNRGNSLGARQVHRIVRHVFDSKCHNSLHNL
jgi:hypothetical protein